MIIEEYRYIQEVALDRGDPMEVDFILLGGKGPKGCGKGKGAGDGKCFVCGKPGHAMKNCRVKPAFEKGKAGGNDKNSETTKDKDKQQKLIKCFACGKFGHLGEECRTGNVCYACGEPGHLRRDCRDEDVGRKTVQEVEEEEVEVENLKWILAVTEKKIESIDLTVTENENGNLDRVVENERPDEEYRKTTECGRTVYRTAYLGGLENERGIVIGGDIEIVIDSGAEIHVMPVSWIRPWLP